MKNVFLFLSLSVGLYYKAQDTIIFKNGNKFVSLVMLLGEDSIRYKKINNLTGPDLYVHDSLVSIVKFKNGSKSNVDSLYREHRRFVQLTAPTGSATPKQMYDMGVLDATTNYKCKGCVPAFFVTGLFLGPFAAAPAFPVAFTPPLKRNLAYPSEELWKDTNYQKGYKNQTGRIKRRSVLPPAGIGCFIFTVTGGLIYTLINRS
jgi:hypothetical protein